MKQKKSMTTNELFWNRYFPSHFQGAEMFYVDVEGLSTQMAQTL